MATSGNYVLNRTADEIIESALRRATIIPVEQSVSAVDRATALEALNSLVARLQAQGFHLWKQVEYVLPLNQAQRSYDIGPTGDFVCFEDDFITDTLSADVTTGATQIVIASTARFTGADNILTFDPTDETANWTTVDATLAAVSVGLELTSTVGASEGYTEYEFSSDITSGIEYFVQLTIDSLTTTNLRIEVYDVGITTTLLDSTLFSTTGIATVTFTPNQTTILVRLVNDDLTASGVSTFGDLRLRQSNTGEQIGVRVSAALREWNVVKRVINATTLELVNATANDFDEDASVFAFKSFPPRPLKIRNVRSKKWDNTSEQPVTIWSRSEYQMQTVKDTQGLPTQAYYQPTLTNGEMFVWQVANDVDQILLFDGDVPLQIFDDNSDAPDFPSEWFDCLSWNLAKMIAPEYGVPINRLQIITAFAQETLEEAEDWDEEQGSLYIGLDRNVKT